MSDYPILNGVFPKSEQNVPWTFCISPNPSGEKCKGFEQFQFCLLLKLLIHKFKPPPPPLEFPANCFVSQMYDQQILEEYIITLSPKNLSVTCKF